MQLPPSQEPGAAKSPCERGRCFWQNNTRIYIWGSDCKVKTGRSQNNLCLILEVRGSKQVGKNDFFEETSAIKRNWGFSPQNRLLLVMLQLCEKSGEKSQFQREIGQCSLEFFGVSNISDLVAERMVVRVGLQLTSMPGGPGWASLLCVPVTMCQRSRVWRAGTGSSPPPWRSLALHSPHLPPHLRSLTALRVRTSGLCEDLRPLPEPSAGEPGPFSDVAQNRSGVSRAV